MTTRTTLTDRYVWAVVRLLPDHQRDEIGREVRALIGDLVESREPSPGPSGERDADPERAALIELGDPNLLAAGYVEEPRALIGPELFPQYIRTLKLVAVIAVPALVALTIFGKLVGGDANFAEVLWSAVSAAFQGAVQVAFWVTLVYAFAHKWKADSPWTPDDLPEAVELASSDGSTARRGPSVGELVFGIVFTVLAGGLLVWREGSPFAGDGDERIPALHPELWNGAGQALLVLLGLSVVIQCVVLAIRRWTYGWATANLLVNAGSMGVVAWMAFDDRLINPRLLALIADGMDRTEAITISPWAPVLVVLAIEAWATAGAYLRAYRQDRSGGAVRRSR